MTVSVRGAVGCDCGIISLSYSLTFFKFETLEILSVSVDYTKGILWAFKQRKNLLIDRIYLLETLVDFHRIMKFIRFSEFSG